MATSTHPHPHVQRHSMRTFLWHLCHNEQQVAIEIWIGLVALQCLCRTGRDQLRTALWQRRVQCAPTAPLPPQLLPSPVPLRKASRFVRSLCSCSRHCRVVLCERRARREAAGAYDKSGTHRAWRAAADTAQPTQGTGSRCLITQHLRSASVTTLRTLRTPRAGVTCWTFRWTSVLGLWLARSTSSDCCRSAGSGAQLAMVLPAVQLGARRAWQAESASGVLPERAERDGPEYVRGHEHWACCNSLAVGKLPVRARYRTRTPGGVATQP